MQKLYLLLAVVCCAAQASAQEHMPPERLFPEAMPMSGEPCCEPEEEWLQVSLSRFSVTEIFGSKDRQGWTAFDTGLTLSTSRFPRLSITPGFGIQFLDGPVRTDLPPRLFRNTLAIDWQDDITDRWSYRLNFTPGVWSDYRSNTVTLRGTGRAEVSYRCLPTLKLSLGALALPRDDIGGLIYFGLLWTPTERWEIELTAPRSRVAFQWSTDAFAERWLYVALNPLSGATWNVERANGVDDEVTIRDQQLTLGVEARFTDGGRWFVEGGVVFDRKVEFDSQRGDYCPPTTAVIRAGIGY